MKRCLPAVLLCALVALVSCKRPTAPAAEAKTSAPAPPLANAVLVRIDLSDVTAEQVYARLAAAGTPTAAKAIVEVMMLATTDTLVLRELAVLGHHPASGEPPHVAAERFLRGIWGADDGCPNIERGAIRQAWMVHRGRLHHARRSTIWEGQFVCCATPAACTSAQAVACKRRLHPAALKLAQGVRAALPPSPLPAATTVIAMADSPLVQSHGPVVEEAVAELSAQVTELRLRRYSFDDQDQPGFPGSSAKATEPEVEAAARAAALGAAIGPVETPWGWSVMVLVAREAARRAPFEAAATQAMLRRLVCSERVQAERHAYRKRLLAGARLLWRRPAIEAAFGAEVVAALPPDASDREPPHVPGMGP